MKGAFVSQLNIFIEYLNRSFVFYQNQLNFITVFLFTVLFAFYSIMASQVQVTDLTKGISSFALDFYQECAQSKPGDVIISPLSVASALALLSQGSGGNTFEQLRQGLHLTGDKATAANQFAEYYGLLEKSVGKSTLSIANQIYVQKGYEINKNFKEVAVKKFQSGIDEMNFAENVASAKAINSFVEDKTKEKIKDLIKPDMLDALTRVVLVNAIYFKGNWEYQFNKESTTQGDFYISETDTVPVDFMYIKKKFNYAVLEELDATALEMKYANSNFSFVIVLPNSRTGLPALEAKLKNYDLAKITDQMHKHEVEVTIPKFKVEFEISLNDVLKKMGMSDMFSKSNADLSGLLESPEPLYVSNVVHKAFIEVNEEGSEAAAATAIMMMKCSMLIQRQRIIFRADHPYIYFISDTTNTCPIFTGSYTKLN
ncbi:antichymotrypsin-2-like isoform X3 [Sitodiplosis mosellana]|uniref:antichymotrypsin-2-like isoform X3 n=1 Tax=Sitodiplosis mosellana TaxID=263140 RepID=UPI0024441EB7|nr:antichymotrypsin-2-like isoform X3 [Sitodiplosis mosellana]